MLLFFLLADWLAHPRVIRETASHPSASRHACILVCRAPIHNDEQADDIIDITGADAPDDSDPLSRPAQDAITDEEPYWQSDHHLTANAILTDRLQSGSHACSSGAGKQPSAATSTTTTAAIAPQVRASRQTVQAVQLTSAGRCNMHHVV